MPYRNNGGPEDYYDQSSAFNPYTGRLNGGQLVMQFLQRMQAEKDRKKQEGWDVEDRGMKKQAAEANVAETKANTERLLRPPAEPKPRGYTLPPSVLKEVAKYHGFTNESEYDSYDPQLQQDMAKEYMDAKAMAAARGLKFTPNKQGALKLKMIDTALAQINKRSGEIGGELRAFIMQPMSDPKGEGAAVDRKILSNLNRLRMRFSTYPWKMDEGGTLPEAYEKELIDYLNSPDSVETGRAFDTQKPTPESTIPANILAAAKKARPDLTDQEIIDAWKAKKK